MQNPFELVVKINKRANPYSNEEWDTFHESDRYKAPRKASLYRPTFAESMVGSVILPGLLQAGRRYSLFHGTFHDLPQSIRVNNIRPFLSDMIRSETPRKQARLAPPLAGNETDWRPSFPEVEVHMKPNDPPFQKEQEVIKRKYRASSYDKWAAANTIHVTMPLSNNGTMFYHERYHERGDRLFGIRTYGLRPVIDFKYWDRLPEYFSKENWDRLLKEVGRPTQEEIASLESPEPYPQLFPGAAWVRGNVKTKRITENWDNDYFEDGQFEVFHLDWGFGRYVDNLEMDYVKKFFIPEKVAALKERARQLRAKYPPRNVIVEYVHAPEGNRVEWVKDDKTGKWEKR
jgi:hypothetical protein